MLKLAVKAQLPIVEVTTRDLVNFPDVVKHVAGKTPKPWGAGPATIATGGLYYHVATKASPEAFAEPIPRPWITRALHDRAVWIRTIHGIHCPKHLVVTAAQTEFEKPLVVSTLTLAIVVGLSVRDTSENAATQSNVSARHGESRQ